MSKEVTGLYIDIGDLIIDSKKIIGMFDIDKTTVFKVNRNYLSNMEKRGKIISNVQKIPKSFIIYRDGNCNLVYISPLMVSTIVKRLSGDKHKILFGGE